MILFSGWSQRAQEAEAEHQLEQAETAPATELPKP